MYSTKYRPTDTLCCVECGQIRPQFSPRCPCGSAHTAQSRPNDETLTWDAAEVFSPLAVHNDVLAMRAEVDRKRNPHRKPTRAELKKQARERAAAKLESSLPVRSAPPEKPTPTQEPPKEQSDWSKMFRHWIPPFQFNSEHQPAPPRSGSDGPGTSESTDHEPPASRHDGMTGSEPLCPGPESPSDEPA